VTESSEAPLQIRACQAAHKHAVCTVKLSSSSPTTHTNPFPFLLVPSTPPPLLPLLPWTPPPLSPFSSSSTAAAAATGASIWWRLKRLVEEGSRDEPTTGCVGKRPTFPFVSSTSKRPKLSSTSCMENKHDESSGGRAWNEDDDDDEEAAAAVGNLPIGHPDSPCCVCCCCCRAWLSKRCHSHLARWTRAVRRAGAEWRRHNSSALSKHNEASSSSIMSAPPPSCPPPLIRLLPSSPRPRCFCCCCCCC
jgi:hypothetical protein